MSSQKKDVITLFRLFRLDKNFVFFYLVCNLGGGGVYNGRSRNLMKIQAPLGGPGGMLPHDIFDIFVL